MACANASAQLAGFVHHKDTKNTKKFNVHKVRRPFGENSPFTLLHSLLSLCSPRLRREFSNILGAFRPATPVSRRNTALITRLITARHAGRSFSCPVHLQTTHRHFTQPGMAAASTSGPKTPNCSTPRSNTPRRNRRRAIPSHIHSRRIPF